MNRLKNHQNSHYPDHQDDTMTINPLQPVLSCCSSKCRNYSSSICCMWRSNYFKVERRQTVREVNAFCDFNASSTLARLIFRRNNTWRNDAIKMEYPLEKMDPLYYWSHVETSGTLFRSTKELESDILCVVEKIILHHSQWWVKKHRFAGYRSAPTKPENLQRVYL